MKRNKNESGRSMVEMLGVLAIIGVLSVGGIAGYRVAMDKMQVNQLLPVLDIFSEVASGDENMFTTIYTDDVLTQIKTDSTDFCNGYIGSDWCTDLQHTDKTVLTSYKIPNTDGRWRVRAGQVFGREVASIDFIIQPTVCEQLLTMAVDQYADKLWYVGHDTAVFSRSNSGEIRRGDIKTYVYDQRNRQNEYNGAVHCNFAFDLK